MGVSGEDTMKDSMGIPHEDFDREYVLSELIPDSYFRSLAESLAKMGMMLVGVVLQDGSWFYRSANVSGDSPGDLQSPGLDFSEIGHELLDIDDRTKGIPVIHELEPIACLVMRLHGKDTPFGNRFDNFFSLIQKNVEQVIYCNYKNRLAFALHNQVVEESFEEIRKKTALLAESEKKYRTLAESLEVEIVRKTREIKEAQGQLLHQEKLASIGQLAAGVAHEINNPMGFITSNLRTLTGYTRDLFQALEMYRRFVEEIEAIAVERGDCVPAMIGELRKNLEPLDIVYLFEDVPQLLRESLSGAERINKIVLDLKDFAHPGEEDPVYSDVIQCIESTLNIVWNELKYKAKVVKSFTPLPMIFCRPRQLNQVIMNLLVNAVQAMDRNGTIEIRTADHGDRVELAISDTGHGIPEENLSKIFDPFFTTKDVGKGTGLGLNLVYNIIKKHHGTIDVKSTMGEGTTFTIFLPVDPKEP
jgi:signal transduction histidine kinase